MTWLDEFWYTILLSKENTKFESSHNYFWNTHQLENLLGIFQYIEGSAGCLNVFIFIRMGLPCADSP